MQEPWPQSWAAVLPCWSLSFPVCNLEGRPGCKRIPCSSCDLGPVPKVCLSLNVFICEMRLIRAAAPRLSLKAVSVAGAPSQGAGGPFTGQGDAGGEVDYTVGRKWGPVTSHFLMAGGMWVGASSSGGGCTQGWCDSLLSRGSILLLFSLRGEEGRG